MNQTYKKFIASLIVAVMVITNFSTLGFGIGEVYAADELESQNVKTNEANVEFDAYFKNGDSNVHSEVADMATESKVFATLKVKNAGYLKNAKLEFLDSSDTNNANFKVVSTAANEYVQSVDSTANTVLLNQVNNGGNVSAELNIKFNERESINISEFNKENHIKLTGTYVNAKGEEVAIEKVVKVNLSWNAKPELVLEQSIEKYVPYNVNGKTGVILQKVIKSGIKDNILPIQSTNLEVNVPVINETKPSNVIVTSNSTFATNGKQEGLDFTDANWSYDEANGKVNINVENVADTQGNITWRKGNMDEYVVTYVYEGVTLDKAVTVSLDVKANVNAYNSEITKLEKEVKSDVELSEKINDIVTFNVESLVSSISKSNTYANFDKADNKYETAYSMKYKANVGFANLIDKVTCILTNDKYVDGEGSIGYTSVNGVNYAYIKNLVMEKRIFDKMLGEEGYVKVSNLNGEELAVINKDTQVDTYGNYVIALSDKDVNEVIVETSKPITEGQIIFNVEKALKGDQVYSKDQMKLFKEMQFDVTGKVEAQSSVLAEVNTSAKVPLTEVASKAQFDMNVSGLSTVVENQNVELKAILNTNTTDCALYVNPTIKLELPSYIEEMNITSINVLFDDELKLAGSNMYDENGHKYLVINLEGTQTKYGIGSMSKGTVVSVVANIKTNQLTPNRTEQINMQVINNNDATEVKEVNVSKDIKFIAPVGLVAVNSISNYADGQSVTAVSVEEKNAQLAIASAARTARVDLTVINNYENELNNIYVLGRTPVKGTTSVINGEENKVTFDATMTSPISIVSGVDASSVKIYYSTIGNATNDLNDAKNAWTTQVSDFSLVKSYMIVFDNYTMAAGSVVRLGYDINIPEGLDYNQKTTQSYGVFYSNPQANQLTKETSFSAPVTLATSTRPELNVTMATDAKQISAGQYVTYKVNIKNTGSIDATNVKYELPILDNYKVYEQNYDVSMTGTSFVEAEGTSYVKNIEKIAAGEETSFEVQIKFFNGTSQVSSKVTADDLTDGITTNTTAMTVAPASLVLKTSTEGVVKELYGSGKLELKNSVENITDNDLTNVEIKVHIPDGIKFELTDESFESLTDMSTVTSKSYDVNTRTFTVVYDNLEGKRVLGFKLYLNVENNSAATSATFYSTVKANSVNEVRSNELTFPILKSGVNVKTYSDIEVNENIEEYKQINYSLEISNNGEDQTRNAKVKINVDSNLKIVGYKTILNGEESEQISNDDEGTIDFYPTVYPGTKVIIKVCAEAKRLPDGITSQAIGTNFEITGDNFPTITTDVIKNTIVKSTTEFDDTTPDGSSDDGGTDEPQDGSSVPVLPSDPSNPSNPTGPTYKIAGVAWIDSNKDGSRDDNEEKISNVEVMLLNKTTGQFLTNTATGAPIRVVTSAEGKYEFAGVPDGTYTVVFIYNSGIYGITTQKAEGVAEERNSDAIETKLEIDGLIRLGAITEDISVNGSNVYNIDIGLVAAERFDLSLDKTVSSVSVQNPTGSQKYEYNNKLAKRELISKYVDSTTVVIEYKLTVKNEGAIAGYAKKIADYIPSELKFNSELNPDWYTAENGVAYTSSLANELIQPGETRDVTIYLTKQLSDDSLGIINNSAEIFESYNDLGLDDIDSIAGNKASNEDDLSTADVLLTIRTGRTVTYVGITLAVLTVIATGVYGLKNKNKKESI